MVGKGRHPILGLTSPDPVLARVGPIGLAASLGTALVVDLGSNEHSSEQRTMHDLAVDGPSLSELSPARPGVAMLLGGGVELSAAIDLIAELARRWPAVVVAAESGTWPFPIVPAIPLYPGRLMAPPQVSHCVWQPIGSGATPPGPGHILPRLRPGQLRRLLSGHLPRRSRWVAAWRPVWEMPWA